MNEIETHQVRLHYLEIFSKYGMPVHEALSLTESFISPPVRINQKEEIQNILKEMQESSLSDSDKLKKTGINIDKLKDAGVDVEKSVEILKTSNNVSIVVPDENKEILSTNLENFPPEEMVIRKQTIRIKERGNNQVIQSQEVTDQKQIHRNSQPEQVQTEEDDPHSNIPRRYEDRLRYFEMMASKQTPPTEKKMQPGAIRDDSK